MVELLDTAGQATTQARPIIKDRKLQEDVWTVVTLDDGAAAPDVESVTARASLLPLALWRAGKDSLIDGMQRTGVPLGVWLGPDDDVAEIADDLGHFAVIGVFFPKFTDGRGYSTARLLRERYGYQRELRAFGDIGRDQLYYLSRVGFDAFLLGEGRDAAAALAAFDDFPESYQGAVVQPVPLFRRRHASPASPNQELAHDA